VALPFPPDDPLYGARAGADIDEFGLGAVELRGERGVLVLPPALLMRLRYNPFFDYVAQRIDAVIDPRGAGTP
jgi:hypothetical protein